MMKIKTYLICALFLITGLLSAQSNGELAKSYFLQAQEAYGNSKTKAAIQLLDKCVKTLGETNPKIEAFYIKIKRTDYKYEMFHALETKQHLETYLSLATEDRSEYDEVIKLATSIKSAADRYTKNLSEALEANKERNWEESGPVYIDYMGYFNGDGERAFDDYFEKGGQFINGYAIVERYGNYLKRNYMNLIDINGKLFSSRAYNNIIRKSEGVYLTFTQTKNYGETNGIINTYTGNELGSYNYSAGYLEQFQDNGIAVFYTYKKIRGEEVRFKGLASNEGTILVKANYKEIYPFRNGYARAFKTIKVNKINKEVWHYIKKDGSVIEMKPGWVYGNLDEDGRFRFRKSNSNEGWGYQNGSKVIIKPILDFAWDFSDGLAIVQNNKKTYVIDTDAKVKGTITEKFTFEEGYGLFNNGKAILRNSARDGCFIIDETGKAITENLKCYSMKFISENTLLIRGSETYLADLQFNKLTNFGKIYNIEGFNEGVAVIKIKDEINYGSALYGYINKNGAIVIPPIHHDAEPFKDGKAIVYDKYYNKTIIKPLIRKYGREQLISEGLTVVYQEGNYGFINQSEKMIIDLKFEDAWNFENGRAQVKIDDKIGFIDKTGKMVIPAKFDEFTFDLTHNANIGTIDGKKGLYSKDGTEIVPPIYNNIQSRNEFGVTIIESKGLKGILDKDYNVLVTPKYDDIGIYGDSNEFIAIQKNNLWGLLDFDGNEVFAPQFKYISIFHSTHNLATAINSDGKYGFINKYGQIVIPLEYHQATKFYENGLAGIRLAKSGFWGFIDTTGNIVVQPKYYSIYKMEDNCSFIPVRYRDRKGDDSYKTYISQKGELYNHKDNYDRVECKEEYLKAYKGRRIFKIDKNGDRTKL